MNYHAILSGLLFGLKVLDSHDTMLLDTFVDVILGPIGRSL